MTGSGFTVTLTGAAVAVQPLMSVTVSPYEFEPVTVIDFVVSNPGDQKLPEGMLEVNFT